jgi:Uncharacterised nucleotidyltransferase
VSRSARAALLPLVRGQALDPPRSPEAARELVAEARRQGVVANLRAAAERAPEGWPPALREELAQQHHRQLARGLRQLQVAADAQQLLARAGVRSLPLKGAALAEDLYESVADRPMADVDLLLLDDFPAGLTALLGAGFTVEDGADHAVCLGHGPSGVRLEAHRGLASCPGLHPVDAEGWWARRRRGPDGEGARPSREDLLVQLALHAAFQHGLVLSLVQYQDLRRIVESESESAPIDHEALAARLRECAAAAALAATLRATAAVTGLALEGRWRALSEALPARLGRWLARRARDPLALLAPAPPPLLRLRWELARGRRRAWLREAFRGAPPPGGAPAPGPLPRGARLVRTWAAAARSGSRHA